MQTVAMPERASLFSDIKAQVDAGLPSKLDFGHSCGVAEGVGPGRWQAEARFCLKASAW